MKTIRLMTACAAALLLSSCLQVDEPAGIEAIRNAKAELISAEAQYKLAEITLLNAQAALAQATADAQVLENKIRELEIARQTAQNESEILEYEQQMELAILEHQASVLEKQEALAKAQQEYDDALAMLEFAAKEISEEEQSVIKKYTDMLSELSGKIAANTISTKTEAYLEAKYDFQFDYEVTKAEYERDIAIAKADLADREVFVEYVKGLDATAPVADYVAKVDELEAAIEKAEAEIDALEAEQELKEVNEENPLDEQLAALTAEATENATKIADMQLQQKHYFTDNEKYYKQTIDVPPTLVKELHAWFEGRGYLDETQGFVYDYENEAWTATNNQVVVQFDMPTYYYSSYELDHFKNDITYELNTLLTQLNNTYSPYKDSAVEEEADKKAYAAKTQKYVDDFAALLVAAKKASDKHDAEIDALNKKQLEIDLKTSEVALAMNAISVEIAALQKQIDNKDAAKTSLEDLKAVYEGLITGTTIKIPNVPSTDWENDKVEVVTFTDYAISIDPAATQKELDKWASYAEYYLVKAKAELAKDEQKLADYLEAENPERFAEQVALEKAANALELETMLYEMYVEQYEYYSQLLKDFLAAITGSATTDGGGEQA